MLGEMIDAKVNSGRSSLPVAVLLLACLPVLPAIALQRRAAHFRWVCLHMLVMGAISYADYWLCNPDDCD